MRRRYYRGFDHKRALDIDELRQIALRRLPGFVSEDVEGGSEDEQTLGRNREAFRDVRFVHRSLIDVSARSLETTVFGERCALPLAIGPTGFNGLLWKHADIALARAAKAAGGRSPRARCRRTDSKRSPPRPGDCGSSSM